jgi:hypothetical protein
MIKRIFLAATMIVGCQPNPSDPSPDLVWAGWNHTWDILSHRLSYVRAILGEDETLQMGLIGGDWSTGAVASDSPTYRMHYQRVRGGDLQFVQGETEVIVGPEGEVTVPVDIEMALQAPVTIVLRGFEIDTDIEQAADYPSEYTPDLGYTSRGFGFSVSEPNVHAEFTSFALSARVRWGTLDRPDMNAAIPHARTKVRVAWTAIASNCPPVRSRLTDQVPLSHTPPNSEQQGSSWHTPQVQARGIMGITHFDLGLESTDQAGEGEYLRSYGVEIALNEAGLAPQAVSAELLTSSIFELSPMRFSSSVELAWIPVDDESFHLETVSVSGEHEIGPVEIPSRM